MGLVYRALRKVSDLVVGNFYDQILIQGEENVPPKGPLIIASTHHNEIIDIATLAVTMPHGRQVSFWGKESMFRVPVWGWIMKSSGAIPVSRSPNSSKSSSNTNGNDKAPASNPQSKLFEATSRALRHGATIGCFVEGTSYTEPEIVQVKDGASWAAVEYIKWVRNTAEPPKDISIVPTGLVYTDKTRYRSDVIAVYGKPIVINPLDYNFLPEHPSEDIVRETVKALTAQIATRLRDLTINAPDWETLDSAIIARQILWNDSRNLPLPRFISVTQGLINILNSPSEPAIQAAKTDLLKYSSLLRFAQLPRHLQNASTSYSSAIYGTIAAILHPGTLLFIPSAVLHLPMYLTSWLGTMLTIPGEDETVAEHKGVFGGLGRTVSYGIIGWAINRTIVVAGRGFVDLGVPELQHVLEQIQHLPTAGRIFTQLLIVYGSLKLLRTWHNGLVAGNLKRAKDVQASWLIARGANATTISQDRLRLYTVPPPRIVNIFIKKHRPEPAPAPPPVRPSELVQPILHARAAALKSLRVALQSQSQLREIAGDDANI